MADSLTGMKRRGPGKRSIFVLVAFGLLAALVVLRAADPAPVRNLRNAYFDYLQQLAPRPYTPMPVLIVDLDEASLARLGQWPWPRDRLAMMVDRLTEMGAAVVVFDVLFPEPDRLSPRLLVRNDAVRAALSSGPWVEQIEKLDNDVAFAEAMARSAVVLGQADAGAMGDTEAVSKAGFAMIGQDPAASLLPLRSGTPIVPVLAEAAAGIGVVSVNPLGDSDKQRDVPLVWRTPNGFMPGLALEALRVALGETTVVVMGPSEGPDRVTDVRLGDFTVPVTANGLFPIRFRHDDPSQYLPAWQVLDPDRATEFAERVAGSIVFIGASAAGLSDTRTTALGERVPGVSIHAQVVELILLEDYLTRSDATEGGEILALVLLGLLGSGVLLLAGPTLAVLAGGTGAAAVVGTSWYGFTHGGTLFDATFPLVGSFVAFSGLALWQFAVSDREKRLIRQSLSRYVSPGVLEEIDRRGHILELGGTTGEVTVLFCDIRNFTPLSATMSAQDLVALLNELFTDLSEEILGLSGTIDKYIGDEIMAFWNAPLPTEGHQRLACLATLRMRAAMAAYNARSGRAEPIAIAMGMDCGPACVGNIGSRNRFNYTAIGETVNVAARTQSACRHVGCDILVTAAVARAAPTLAFLPAGRIDLKGVSDRIEVYVLAGDEALAASDAFRNLARRYDAFASALATGGPLPEPVDDLAAALARVAPDLGGMAQRSVERARDFS